MVCLKPSEVIMSPRLRLETLKDSLSTWQFTTRKASRQYWPQSDGEVERFNKTLLKTIRIAQLQGKNWKRKVQDFLFHYRSTPHTVTSLSPAELLMGRKLRGKLPLVQSPCDQATEAEWQILLRETYARRK